MTNHFWFVVTLCCDCFQDRLHPKTGFCFCFCLLFVLIVLCRISSSRLALFAVDHIASVLNGRNPVFAVGCGIVRDERSFVSLQDVEKRLDFEARRPKDPFWLDFLQHVFDSVSYPPTEVLKSNL